MSAQLLWCTPKLNRHPDSGKDLGRRLDPDRVIHNEPWYYLPLHRIKNIWTRMKNDRALAEANLAHRLQPLARRWRMIADRALAELGLSDATGWVMLHVGRHGDGVGQTELAAALDINGPSLVRLIDQLEKAGLVARHVDARDRRVNRIELTKAGRSISGNIENALGTVRRQMFAGIDDGDLAIADKVLVLLSERIVAHRDAPK
jgi:MarR family transcriptional regulator for hemolysin